MTKKEILAAVARAEDEGPGVGSWLGDVTALAEEALRLRALLQRWRYFGETGCPELGWCPKSANCLACNLCQVTDETVQ